MLPQRTEIEYVKEQTNHSKLKTYFARAMISVLSAFLLGCPGKLSEVNIFSSQSTESPDCLNNLFGSCILKGIFLASDANSQEDYSDVTNNIVIFKNDLYRVTMNSLTEPFIEVNKASGQKNRIDLPKDLKTSLGFYKTENNLYLYTSNINENVRVFKVQDSSITKVPFQDDIPSYFTLPVFGLTQTELKTFDEIIVLITYSHFYVYNGNSAIQYPNKNYPYNIPIVRHAKLQGKDFLFNAKLWPQNDYQISYIDMTDGIMRDISSQLTLNISSQIYQHDNFIITACITSGAPSWVSEYCIIDQEPNTTSWTGQVLFPTGAGAFENNFKFKNEFYYKSYGVYSKIPQGLLTPATVTELNNHNIYQICADDNNIYFTVNDPIDGNPSLYSYDGVTPAVLLHTFPANPNSTYFGISCENENILFPAATLTPPSYSSGAGIYHSFNKNTQSVTTYSMGTINTPPKYFITHNSDIFYIMNNRMYRATNDRNPPQDLGPSSGSNATYGTKYLGLFQNNPYFIENGYARYHNGTSYLPYTAHTMSYLNESISHTFTVNNQAYFLRGGKLFKTTNSLESESLYSNIQFVHQYEINNLCFLTTASNETYLLDSNGLRLYSSDYNSQPENVLEVNGKTIAFINALNLPIIIDPSGPVALVDQNTNIAFHSSWSSYDNATFTTARDHNFLYFLGYDLNGEFRVFYTDGTNLYVDNGVHLPEASSLAHFFSIDGKIVVFGYDNSNMEILFLVDTTVSPIQLNKIQLDPGSMMDNILNSPIYRGNPIEFMNNEVYLRAADYNITGLIIPHIYDGNAVRLWTLDGVSPSSVLVTNMFKVNDTFIISGIDMYDPDFTVYNKLYNGTNYTTFSTLDILTGTYNPTLGISQLNMDWTAFYMSGPEPTCFTADKDYCWGEFDGLPGNRLFTAENNNLILIDTDPESRTYEVLYTNDDHALIRLTSATDKSIYQLRNNVMTLISTTPLSDSLAILYRNNDFSLIKYTSPTGQSLHVLKNASLTQLEDENIQQISTEIKEFNGSYYFMMKKDNKWGLYTYSPTDEEFTLKTELIYKENTSLQDPSSMTMANGILYFKAAVSSVTKLFGYKEN